MIYEKVIRFLVVRRRVVSRYRNVDLVEIPESLIHDAPYGFEQCLSPVGSRGIELLLVIMLGDHHVPACAD